MAFNLLPKDDQYFEDFDRLMAIVREMSGTLRSALDMPHVPADLWQRMKGQERRADGVLRDIFSRLEASFVTPIEREDIHLLTVTIRDMAEAVESVSRCMDMFEVTEPEPDARVLCKALDEMSEQLVIAIHALRTLKPGAVRDATGRVDILEEQIDDLYRQSQRSLFHRRPDAIDLVRWNKIYDLLEEASDHGRHVARTVNRIVVRHS